MKFELNDYHRNIQTEDLIADIKRVAVLLKKKTFTTSEYVKFGKYSRNILLRRIGSWKECLKKADLVPPVDAHGVKDEELLADLKQVADSLGVSYVPRKQYDQHGKYSGSHLTNRFGSWTKCLEAIGIETTGKKKNASKEELFENLEEIWVKLGRQPGYKDMHAPLSKFSGKPYMIRFGSWRKGLEEFVKFVNQDEKPVSENNLKPTPDILAPSPESQKKHKTSRDISWRLRFLIMRRDNFKCRICGKSPAKNPEVELHVDHIKAWAEGGDTTFNNLQTLCSVCNIGKSDLTM